jgi:hypothetical protein
MNNFDFHSPASVADAIKVLGAGDDGRYLAGGQSLLPAMKTGLSMPTLRPASLPPVESAANLHTLLLPCFSCFLRFPHILPDNCCTWMEDMYI